MRVTDKLTPMAAAMSALALASLASNAGMLSAARHRRGGGRVGVE